MLTKIYISYSWKPEDIVIADTVDDDWKKVGLTLIRDKRDIGYKDSIRTFMQSMTTGDYILIIISKGYLESKNCMFEALEVFKDPAFNDKILPIIAPDANIYDAIGRLSYIEYWDKKIIELNKKLKSVNVIANVQSIIQEIQHFTNIRASIDQFSSVLSDMRTVSWPNVKQENYKEVFRYIGIDGMVQ